jgi:hypothetical protein
MFGFLALFSVSSSRRRNEIPSRTHPSGVVTSTGIAGVPG